MNNVDLGKIKEYLVLITKQFQAFGKLVKIESVDDSKYTCVCSLIDNPEIEYFNVRLSASPTPTFVNIPTVGSVVIMGFLAENQGYISLFSEIDKQIISNSDGVNYSTLTVAYIEAMYDAMMNATFKTSYGPTTPQPINQIEFEKAKSDYVEGIKKLYGE